MLVLYISHPSVIVRKEYWSNVRALLEPRLPVCALVLTFFISLLFPKTRHIIGGLMYFPSICCSPQGILVKCQGLA